MPPRARPIIKPRCKNCRLRKVKCDYVKPRCGQCTRLNLVCQGPDKSLVFVEHNFNSGDTDQTTSTKNRHSVLRKNMQLQSSSALPPSIGHGQQQVVFQKFLTRFMPHAASDLDIFEGQWIMQLPDISRQFKPLDLAVDAFATAICAKTDPTAQLDVIGMNLYGQALRQLSEYYSNSKQAERYWHEAALTSIMLSLYEPVSGDWQSQPGIHLQGVFTLLQRGTSKTLGDPRFQSTFSLVRVTMIIQSIMGTVVELPGSAWCFQPWGDMLQDPLHRSLDVLVHVTGYRALAEELCSNNYTPTDLLKFEAWKKQLLLDFESWYIEECRLQGGELFEPIQLQPDEKDALLRYIGYDIHFKAVRNRLAMNAYWVGKMVLFREWEKVQMHIYQDVSNFPQELKERHEQELAHVSELADHMCLSALQLTDEAEGIIGLSSIRMPLWASYTFFCGHGRAHRVEWCKRLLQKQRCWPFRTNYLQA